MLRKKSQNAGRLNGPTGSCWQRLKAARMRKDAPMSMRCYGKGR